MPLQTNGSISLGDIGQEFQLTQPYKMSDMYDKGGSPVSGTLKISDFYGRSNFQIVLQQHTFEVYTTKTSIIPIANILAGSVDEWSGGNDPLTMVSVQNFTNGSVVVNGTNVEFTSTGAVGVAAGFGFTVRNTSGEYKDGYVDMNVSPIPPIIANPDTYELQQGETLLMSKSNLANNDVDGQGKTLTVDWVGNAVGGNVSLNGDTLSFVSTGLSGQPAQFDYRVTNGIESQIGKVYINVTPLPEQEYYLYQSNNEATTAVSELSPPTVADVFNTWARIDGANYFVDKSTATGSAAHWQLLTNPDRVLQPDNTSLGCGFISPDLLDNYTFEATLTSNNSDNDQIGLIIAFVRDGSVNKTLSAIRTKGGQQPSSGWGLIYTENGPWVPTWTINNISVGGVNGGFSGAQTRVKIQRQGDIIKAYTTNWNDVNNYQISSEIVLDLNSDSRLQIFKGLKPYGYYTHSQSNSTYLNVKFSGGVELNKIFDAETGKVWEYLNGQWVDTGRTVQDDIGYIRKVTNPETNQRFIVKQSTIEYLGKLTTNGNFNSTRILNEDQLVKITSINNSSGAASGVQVVGLYEKGVEEKNLLKGKPTLTTSSTHSYLSNPNGLGYTGFNFMHERGWFSDNGIDIGTLSLVGGYIVFSNGIVGEIKAVSDGSSSNLNEKSYVYYNATTDYRLYDKLI
jgi:hypothetical protein